MSKAPQVQQRPCPALEQSIGGELLAVVAYEQL